MFTIRIEVIVESVFFRSLHALQACDDGIRHRRPAMRAESNFFVDQALK